MITDEPTVSIEPTKTRKPRTRSIVSWLALLAILIAVTCWFQLAHQQKKSRNNYSQLQNSFSQTQLTTTELSTAFNQLKNQVAQQTDQLTNLERAFNRSQASDSEQALDNTLNDVEHTVVQANLTLNYNDNIPAAITLLQTADNHLSRQTDANVFHLRNQLALTLVKLQAIAQPDLVGLLSQIAAVSAQVQHLPLFALADKTAQFKTKALATTPQNETWFAQGLRVSMETLKSLVIIRHRDQTITPLLNPQQEQFLRQNLCLMLQQASWAVLQHNQAIYQYSLNQAKIWLQHYFADNEQATIALNAQLTALATVNIAPNTPDLTPLLQSIHDLQQSNSLQMNHTAPVKVVTGAVSKATPVGAVV